MNFAVNNGTPSPILRVPALELSLRCPDRRCRQPVEYMHLEERARGVFRCTRTSCRQRWFAEPLDAGDVRSQLEAAYLDPQIALDVMRRFQLPAVIESRMFLQVPLSRELWTGYVSDQDARPRNKTIRLIRELLAGVHLAPARSPR